MREGLMQIVPGDLADQRVIDLLVYHLTHSRAHTAPGSAHALDLKGLQSPDISFWTAWDGGTLVAMGALKQLSEDHGEVKSMRTAQDAQRKGVGSAMLRYIVSVARSRGFSRLSLETGSWDYFRPAVAFYKSHGFVECPPFADYALDPNSIFMTLDLRKSQLKYTLPVGYTNN
jgi:putative acetyltransferase